MEPDRPEPEHPGAGPDSSLPSAPPGPGTGSASTPGSGRTSTGWVIGAALYVGEVVLLGVLSLVFGGLSAMLADTCFSDSTELICEPRWQTFMALTAPFALVVTVIVMGALMLWRRRTWAAVTAIVVTPVVPTVAFLIMQGIVTA